MQRACMNEVPGVALRVSKYLRINIYNFVITATQVTFPDVMPFTDAFIDRS